MGRNTNGKAKEQRVSAYFTPTYTARRWKMGGYIWLSYENLQKINRGLNDSSSVKNQRDFHQLIVDVAEIVKRVYSMLLQDSSKRAIALYLNEHGIPPEEGPVRFLGCDG